MIRQTASPLKRGEIEVDGGWTIWVPEIRMVGADEARFYSLLRQLKVPTGRLHDEVQQTAQTVFGAEWSQRLRKVVGYRAREYVGKFGSLKGFDPALVQRWFWPTKNVGRAGERHWARVYAEMRGE